MSTHAVLADEWGGLFHAWDTKRPSRISQPYTSVHDAQALANWLNERAAGYPMRDLPWPPDRPIMPTERACVSGPCCRARRLEIERANKAAYHGDIDGDFNY